MSLMLLQASGPWCVIDQGGHVIVPFLAGVPLQIHQVVQNLAAHADPVKALHDRSRFPLVQRFEDGRNGPGRLE